MTAPEFGTAQNDRWSPRRIMNIVDVRILDAISIHGGCEPEIQVARENVGRVLHRMPVCSKPETIDADCKREILIVWKSAFGEVEIDTGENGKVAYYARRVEGAQIEGQFEMSDDDEVRRVMSWLDEVPEGTGLQDASS